MKINSRVVVMREAIVKIVHMLSMKKVQVTLRGSQAFVQFDRRTNEAKRVNLPYLPDDATDELLDAVQGFLDHEVAHILYTDNKAGVEAKKRKVHTLWNIIEDCYIERKMTGAFKGTGLNLSRVRQFVFKQYIDKALRERPEQANSILLMPAFRAWSGQADAQDYMRDKWHLIERVTRKLGPDMDKMMAGIENSHDSLKAAEEVYRRIKETPAEGSPMGGTEESDEPGEAGEAGEPGEKGKPGEGESKESKGKDKKEKKKQAKKKDDDADDAKGEEKGDGDAKDKSSEGKDETEDGSEKDGSPDADEGGERPGADDGDGGDKGADPKEASPEDGAGSDLPDLDELDDEANKGAGGDGEGDDDDDGAAPGGDDADEEGDGSGGESGDETGGKPSLEQQDDEPMSDKIKEAKTGTPGGIGDHSHDPTLIDELEAAPPIDFDEAAAEVITERALKEAEDSDYLVFTKDYDVVEVLEVPRHMHEDAVKNLAETVDHMVAPLQKDVERAIAARSLAVWTGGHRSGKLHAASLTRMRFGRDDVFRRKQVNRSKDVAVELVVDASGSMGGAGKIQTAVQAAYAFSSVLDRMNIANEVICFTTGAYPRDVLQELLDSQMKMGRRYSRNEPLYMPILKNFGERLTPDVKRRFAFMVDGAHRMSQNVDGESIQVAGMRLLARRETRKVMIVLSDGLPACSGSTGNLNDHLKQVVRQLTQRAVDIVGIGINSEAVKRFYPKYVLLTNVRDLPGECMKQIKTLLTQV